MEDLAHRKKFKPAVHFYGTYPDNEDLWSLHFNETKGRLDVFHFVQRISDTLRPTHCKFREALHALSACIYQKNEDDVAAVKRALMDGSLNGKQHTTTEIKELVDNGTLWRRYAKYVATMTFSDKTIEEMIYGADGWASRWPYEVDETTNETLGTIATDKALANQRTHCADISDVESHNIRLKRLPNQRHTLQVVKKTRGGKVEAFHTVLGDFANGNMQPRTAQMLVMEGAARFSIDRDRELDYQLGANSLDGGHYRSWLRLEANRLAEAAGFEKPYPNEPELGEDSGERFCYDYWLEQRKREQKYEYTSSMKYCPCERCVARRKTCKCNACTAWRFLPDNIDETFLEVAEAIDSVEEPNVAGSEMEVDTETTVRPQGVTAGFMESLPMSTTTSMPTTLRSEADKLKGKKKLADVRKMTACPACTCGKVKENADENARRAAAGQKNAHVRGPQSYCAKTCEQWSWIVREGYRKDDRK